MKRLLLILAAAATGAAHAVPVTFTSVQYDVSAIAEAGAAFDGPNDVSGDAVTLPLIAVADADTGDDFASASGIADTFFLASTAGAFSTGEFAGAVGVASFLGEFSGAGRYRLTVDFACPSRTLLPWWRSHWGCRVSVPVTCGPPPVANAVDANGPPEQGGPFAFEVRVTIRS